MIVYNGFFEPLSSGLLANTSLCGLMAFLSFLGFGALNSEAETRFSLLPLRCTFVRLCIDSSF